MSLKANSFVALQNDRHSGSSTILKKTIDWILNSLSEGTSGEEVLAQLRQLCQRHSTMALLWSLERFFTTIPPNSARVRAWMDMYQRHETAACRHFAHHLTNFRNILVHSNSGLLCTSLKLVYKPLNIFCTESRPSFEGRLLAESLTDTPHRIYLITDMAAFGVIPRVDVLAFGCDCITPLGIVNKIGTAALSYVAQAYGKKAVFVGTSEKQMHWHDQLLMRQGPREDIYKKSEPKILVENYYFDVTPPGSVGGLFLEGGPAGNFNV